MHEDDANLDFDVAKVSPSVELLDLLLVAFPRTSVGVDCRTDGEYI